MSAADDYNVRRWGTGYAGRHVSELTRAWQKAHGLVVDGKLGPKTVASIDLDPTQPSIPRSTVRYWPLAALSDGRRPKITSGSKWRNPSRATHYGCDLFYDWLATDPEVPVGDGGAIMKNGKRRWWYPPDAYVRATEDGVVTYENIAHQTGGLIWISHARYRTGYMHLSSILVAKNQRVVAGQIIARPGDNPAARDAKHLHFEVSSLDAYRPEAPEPYLAQAAYLSAGRADEIDGAD